MSDTELPTVTKVGREYENTKAHPRTNLAQVSEDKEKERKQHEQCMSYEHTRIVNVVYTYGRPTCSKTVIRN